MDSGIAAHPDLNIIGGRNFVTSKGPFSPGPDDYADVAGHGTAVSGVAAARNNGAGVWGVLPGAALFAVKVLGNDQTGTAVDIARALQWIAENGTSLGISVINLSVGGSDSPSDDLLVCQAAEAVSARGMVFVGAAGNAQSDMRASVPAKCSAVIAVTAVALLGQGPYYKVQPATFSNWWVPWRAACNPSCELCGPHPVPCHAPKPLAAVLLRVSPHHAALESLALACLAFTPPQAQR